MISLAVEFNSVFRDICRQSTLPKLQKICLGRIAGTLSMTFLVQKRHTLILDHLDREEAISIKELSDLLNASRETIRKDIALLSKEGRLTQVRGGAVRIQGAEAAFTERADVNPQGKRAIARAAAKLIPDGASVMIDSGTTTQAAARELATRCQNLTIYTNDLLVAATLAPTAKETKLLGGTFCADEHYTIGLDTLDMLSRYRTDFALIGVGGITKAGLFTDFTRDGVALREQMIEISNRSLLLADHFKLGVTGPVRLAKSYDAERLITDKPLPEETDSALAQAGLAVQVA